MRHKHPGKYFRGGGNAEHFHKPPQQSIGRPQTTHQEKFDKELMKDLLEPLKFPTLMIEASFKIPASTLRVGEIFTIVTPRGSYVAEITKELVNDEDEKIRKETIEKRDAEDSEGALPNST